MDEKVIACYLALFERYQPIYLPDGTRERCLIGEVESFILKACENFDCYKVHFYGNELYIQKLIETMSEENPKLEFEVN
jgi:hypothetical protein